MSTSTILLFLLCAISHLNIVSPANLTTTTITLASLTEKRTHAFALLFSCLQCISDTDKDTAEIREINKNFRPEQHKRKYRNRAALERLLQHVRENESQPQRITEPFTYTPENIATLRIILDPLYSNANNWWLFYNTSAWLLQRVNGAQLFWALKIVAAEKFSGTVVTARAGEVFPQLFIKRSLLAGVAPSSLSTEPGPEDDIRHPLDYWMTDPGLNEFRFNWETENPFWWDASKYGVKRDRLGALFFYMHHQVISRVNAELTSNGFPFVTPLKLDPNYVFPEPYHPDIVNINYYAFQDRKEGEKMKDLDDGYALSDLQKSYIRLLEGVNQGYLLKEDGTPEFLLFQNNASNTLASAVGLSTPNINEKYYGSFHNEIRRFLGYLARTKNYYKHGVQALVETSMRDPVFYRLHKLIDELYTKLKTRVPVYTGCQLSYRGIRINEVGIETALQSDRKGHPLILTTYMDNDIYDISTVAKPCQGIGGPPANVNVATLHHDPFNYTITVTSTRENRAYGMVRIFLLPEVDHLGNELDIEVRHQHAIQLDLFPVELKPNEKMIIHRSAMDSFISRRPIPGIKPLYTAKNPSPMGILKNDMKRACGWPQNLLLPKGTKQGLRFKLFVMISEVASFNVRETQFHFGYCGMLNGASYPDTYSMGFPFDRPGTRFQNYDGIPYGNVMQVPILIKHREGESFEV